MNPEQEIAGKKYLEGLSVDVMNPEQEIAGEKYLEGLSVDARSVLK